MCFAYVKSCLKVTDAGLKNLAENMNLKAFEISWNPIVTVQGTKCRIKSLHCLVFFLSLKTVKTLNL